MAEIKTEEGHLIRVVSYEERIAELEKQIADLEKENAELEEHHKSVCETLTNTHRNIREQLTKATDLLKKVIKFTWGEGWNYSLDVKVEAENFLKEIEE